MFRLLGLHAGPDCGAAAGASLAGLPLTEGRRRLAELTRAHLLAEQTVGRFACHDLLRAYAAELTLAADSEAERHAATGRMLDHYLHTAYAAAMRLHPTRKPIALGALRTGVEPEHFSTAGQALAWFEAENQVLMAGAGRALESGFDTHAWQIVWALSRFLDIGGRWHDWAALERIALAAAERLGDRTAEASAHQRFGFASARLGSYDDAYAHLELALSIHGERGNHAGMANVHNSLAITLNYQGRYREALSQARQALEEWTAAGDLNGQAVGLNSVGWFHVVLGDYQEALSYCQQALDMFRDLGSQEGVANVLDSLGYAHQQLGNLSEAAVCYRSALDLHREQGGRWGAAEALGHLGDTQHAAGNFAEARAAWEEALVILTDLQHPDADGIRAKLRELGRSLRSLSQIARILAFWAANSSSVR
jgi:Tfp pilus assembly protein PilF